MLQNVASCRKIQELNVFCRVLLLRISNKSVDAVKRRFPLLSMLLKVINSLLFTFDVVFDQGCPVFRQSDQKHDPAVDTGLNCGSTLNAKSSSNRLVDHTESAQPGNDAAASLVI